MLVLTRKFGEEIVLGGNIRVVVNRISPSRVAIGIIAPDDVNIVRGELVETGGDEDKSEAA